jgi:two-component system cell cycle response regulator
MAKRPVDIGKSGSGLPDLGAEDHDIDLTETALRAASQAPPSSGRDRPFLVILSGGSVGEMYPLKQQETIVGRSQGATIRINDDGISRRHAKLTVKGGELHVEDLKSANGTLVNGERLDSPRLLKDGDKITLGSTIVLKFTYSDDLEFAFQRKMLEAALRDGLTGAFNKRYLMDRLATEIAFAQRHKTPLSLIMLDVDHFKKINDTFGHPAGDQVLVALARVVQEAIRTEDILARFGGEEFAVLCRSVDTSKAGILAERLRERVAAMVVEHEDEPIPVTVSLGVAGFPEVAESSEKLIATADEALYEAKKQGRNRVVLKRRE